MGKGDPKANKSDEQVSPAPPLGLDSATGSNPHPQSPVARLGVADAADGAPKPPPDTKPGTSVLQKSRTTTADIDVSVQILADGVDSSVTGAKTNYNAAGVAYGLPGYSTRKGPDGDTIVDKVNGRYAIKGTITIRTVYNPSAKPSDTSMYGRGTTVQDKAAGEVTLGFHESCHRRDYLDYLRNRPLPVFAGQAKMKESEFKKAETDFKDAFKSYFDTMGAESVQSTDEVGYKRSTCIADGKCKA